MREILFRGKALEGGRWIDGDLRHWPSGAVGICDRATNWTIKVDPETVGQYTGLADKNGVPICEGDVVSGLFLYALPINGVATFRDGSFGLRWIRGGWEEFTPFTSMCNVTYEVLGNIYDNSELMEVDNAAD